MGHRLGRGTQEARFARGRKSAVKLLQLFIFFRNQDMVRHVVVNSPRPASKDSSTYSGRWYDVADQR